LACRPLIKCKKFTTERHGISQKTITKTRKDENTKKMKKNNYYGEFNLETVEDKKRRYQFEELSKKIIGVAIEVHR
jgi:hypothetical protein